jgi:hypothetical protein
MFMIDASRGVLIIADAPPHGRTYCPYDKHQDQDQPMTDLLHQVFSLFYFLISFLFSVCRLRNLVGK